MSSAKRHHWWPLSQSRHWTNSRGKVHVIRSDRSTFLVNPLNIGVESELYTRFSEDNEKDTAIEDWFAEVIDAPVARTIKFLLNPTNIHRAKFAGDPKKKATCRELGFRVGSYIDRIELNIEIRTCIAQYIAALLVRHPKYLSKLEDLHRAEIGSSRQTKNLALNSMLKLYRIYADRIAKSVLLISRRVGTSEYLYADGGISVEEPWRRAFGIPFDIHAPLTPDIAIQVLPIPNPSSEDLSSAVIFEAKNQGVARQNRIILGGAVRFVFSRQMPPISFIVKHFGVPAPQNISYRISGGRLETGYDPDRE